MTHIPTLEEILIKFEYKISGGWEYLWTCFGDKACAMDLYDNIGVVYDKRDQTVYCFSYYDLDDSDENLAPYIWVHPAYREHYYLECKANNTKEKMCDDYYILAEIVKPVFENYE